MVANGTGHDFHEEPFPEQGPVQEGSVERELTTFQEIGYDRDVSNLPPLPEITSASAVAADAEVEEEATTEPEADKTATNVTPIPTVLNRVVEAVPLKEWQLDEQTKQVGRRGIAQARAALRSSKAVQADEQRRKDRFLPPRRSTLR